MSFSLRLNIRFTATICRCEKKPLYNRQRGRTRLTSTVLFKASRQSSKARAPSSGLWSCLCEPEDWLLLAPDVYTRTSEQLPPAGAEVAAAVTSATARSCSTPAQDTLGLQRMLITHGFLGGGLRCLAEKSHWGVGCTQSHCTELFRVYF